MYYFLLELALPWTYLPNALRGKNLLCKLSYQFEWFVKFKKQGFFLVFVSFFFILIKYSIFFISI